MKKRLGWILFVVYVLFILWYTVFSRSPGIPRADLRFMWAYREMFTGHPNWKKDVIQNLQNILFFIPFGVLMPVNKRSVVVVTALCFSLAVEITQYIGGFGLCELDDVICNTLGAMIGMWLWLEIIKIKGKINEA